MKKGSILVAVLILAMVSGCRQITNVRAGTDLFADAKQTLHLEKQGTASRLVVEGKPLRPLRLPDFDLSGTILNRLNI